MCGKTDVALRSFPRVAPFQTLTYARGLKSLVYSRLFCSVRTHSSPEASISLEIIQGREENLFTSVILQIVLSSGHSGHTQSTL